MTWITHTISESNQWCHVWWSLFLSLLFPFWYCRLSAGKFTTWALSACSCSRINLSALISNHEAAALLLIQPSNNSIFCFNFPQGTSLSNAYWTTGKLLIITTWGPAEIPFQRGNDWTLEREVYSDLHYAHTDICDDLPNHKQVWELSYNILKAKMDGFWLFLWCP